MSQHFLACLRSLAVPQIESRFHDIAISTAGTCEWLLRHDAYKRWAGCERGLLWVKGKPGSGKSTLLKYALKHRTSEVGCNELILSFFFHGRGDELQKTPRGFFRSLLHQLLGKTPESLPDLVEAYQKKRREIGVSGKEWQWHKEELRRFLESSLPRVLQNRSVWLFIDALDECGEDNAVDLFRWLKGLLPALPDSSLQFRVFVTCRHYPILDVDCKFEICPEKENKQDISTYVDSQLSDLPELAASSIPRFITDGASGVFMWARLIVEMVLRLERWGSGPAAIWKEIRRVPMELGDLYQELVNNMQTQRSASLKLIKWVYFAIRPLSLDELRWAMVIDPESSCRSLRDFQSSEHWVSDNNRMRRQLQTLSCGLVEVTSSSGIQTVQFIHQSVKDFFLAKGLFMLDENLSSTASLGMVHFQLSKCCLRYLETEEFDQPQRYEEEEFPFLCYVLTSWIPHMKKCDYQGVAHDAMLELLSWPSNELVRRWIRVSNTMEEDEWKLPETDNIVHVLSQNGVLGPLAVVLQREDLTSQEVNAKTYRGLTPLTLAIESGYEAIVKLLLGTGEVDVNSRDNHGLTPLALAVYFRSEAIVRLLLGTGEVDVNSRDDHGLTPLALAVRLGYEAIVRLVLETGETDVNSTDRDGRTPLWHASTRGHEAIVKLLLNTGQAKLHAQDTG